MSQSRQTSRCRRRLDLDASPVAVDAQLAATARRAGPVSSQQISATAARTRAARLLQDVGDEIADTQGDLTHLPAGP